MGTNDPYDRIQAALEKRLLTLTELPMRSNGTTPAVEVENVVYTPENGRVWLSCQLTPSAASRKTAGDGGYSRIDGAFKIAVRGPFGSGTAALRVLADRVVQHFKSGTTLTDGGITVIVLASRRDAGFRPDSSEWYEIPTYVEWYVHSDKV